MAGGLQDAITRTPATPRGDAVRVSRHELLRLWVAAMVAGELLGFVVPAITGSLLFLVFDAPAPAGVPALALAGGVEGATLGYAQWRVLRRYLQHLSGVSWAAVTASAAAVAWAIGMTPSALGDVVSDRPWLFYAGAVVLAPVLLNAVGVAQWWVLRAHLARAGWWIPANAAAWLAGLPFVFAAMAAVPDDAPPAAFAVAGVAGAALMAAAAALVTGAVLVRLLEGQAGGD